MASRTVRTARALAALLAIGALAPTPSAAAPPLPHAATLPQAASSAATPDFDGDGKADIAFTDQHFPFVEDLRVRYGSGRVQVFTPVQVTDVDDGDLVGPVLARDLNADGYADLAFLATLDLQHSDYRLFTLFGSASGLRLESLASRTLAAAEGTTPNFGQLAVVTDPVPRLVVGRFAGGSSLDDGELLAYRLGADGLITGDPLVLAPGKAGVPKPPSQGAFGSSLATDGDRLWVGAPSTEINGKSQAGAVVELTFGTAGVTTGQVITQDTEGVGSDPAEIDWFGSSLAAGDGYLVVGARGETVGKKIFVGSVQVFTTAGGTLVPAQYITQGSRGVPGKDEGGDQFGYSVAIGTVCPGVTGIVVGAPYEAIKSSNEGSAWVLPLTSASGCSAVQLYEGHGFPGKPTFYRNLGEDVAVVRDAGATTDHVVVSGSAMSNYFYDRGRLFVWSGSTRKVVAQIDDNPTSLAGR